MSDKHDEMAREIADQYWGNANPFWNRKGDFEFAIASALRQVERECKAWTEEDQPLPEDEQIIAAHPLHWGRHDLYAEALRLVGAKRSKHALVDLVNWLLLRLDRALSPTPTPTELVDVSTKGELIDRDQSMTENWRLRAALSELCRLKAMKDTTGKTPEYEADRVDAWAVAFALVGREAQPHTG